MAACSIKEDRTPCPCWLSIDFTKVSQKNVNVAAWGDAELFSERIAVKDYLEPESYEKTVPKGYVHTSVISGERDMVRSGAHLNIPLGHDADSIFAHAASVECLGEFAKDTAELHKQFARVFMTVEIPEGHEYPYTFRVCSDVCGMDMRDLSPVEGEFRYDLRLGVDNISMFCIPRQKEDGGQLRILIYDKGEVIETIPLAQWINKMGKKASDGQICPLCPCEASRLYLHTGIACLRLRHCRTSLAPLPPAYELHGKIIQCVECCISVKC